MTLIIKTPMAGRIDNFSAYLERKSKKANTLVVEFPIDPKDSQLLVGACRHNLAKALKNLDAKTIKLIVIPGHGAPDSPRASFDEEASHSFDIGGIAHLVHTLVGQRLSNVKIYSCHSGNGSNCLAAKFSQFVTVPVVGFHSAIRVVSGGYRPLPETESIKREFEELKACSYSTNQLPGFDTYKDRPSLSEHALVLWSIQMKTLYLEEIRADKRTFYTGTPVVE